MDKKQVSAIFEEIATLLELKGENFFKSRANDIGGRTILSLTTIFCLQKIPYYGKMSLQKIPFY